MSIHEEYNGWLMAVDRIIAKSFAGEEIAANADDYKWPWREAFDNGLTPSEAISCMAYELCEQSVPADVRHYA